MIDLCTPLLGIMVGVLLYAMLDSDLKVATQIGRGQIFIQ